jgi:hypothetical protein
LEVHPNDHNAAYLRTKRDRFGHELIFEEDSKGVVLVHRRFNSPG